MYKNLTSALSSHLEEHTTLSRTRQETFVWLVILMVRVGTTSLRRLAAHAQSPVKTLSVHRRFERFFQHVRFNGDEIARLLVEIMGLSGKAWHLALDRTNWKFGRIHINILMLGVVHGKVCVHARSLKRRDKYVLTGMWFLGREERDDPGVPVKIVLMRLKTGELLAVAASGVPVKKALAVYRGRWGIETLFSCMKSRGLGMEDTHMTDPGKLATLTAVLALAFVMAYKTGLWAARFEPPKNKAHGRLQKSLFALGLAALRKILAIFSPAQIFECFHTLLSTQNPRKSLICAAL